MACCIKILIRIGKIPTKQETDLEGEHDDSKNILPTFKSDCARLPIALAE